MHTKEMLTNEEFRSIAKNSFELTTYAIALGRRMILSGQVTTLHLVLEEIKKHPNPNYLDELDEQDKFEMENPV